ncbi:MAG: P1 family peptidase [Bryobacteraceae bacterium]
MKGLTDIEGILVGHATDRAAITGCTAIVCPRGAAAGVDIRGSATGSVQTDVLSSLHHADQIHGLMLSGGSAYGLETAFGLMRFLEKKGIGFPTSAGVVPLVPCAIIFDLPIAKARPGREMGLRAGEAASDAPVAEGCVGAGTGATVGKLFGMKHAMKSGVGSYTVWLDGPYAGVRVAALAVVNAFGDVREAESGHILAGARTTAEGSEFADMAYQLKRGAQSPGFRKENTTLVVVATNARLDKAGATKLAQFGSIGVAKTITPVWTPYDGDITFGLSCGDEKADIVALGVAAAEAVEQAILRSVRRAESLGGIPGLG